MSTPDQRAWAHGLVSAFRTRTTNVAWFNARRQVADELDIRIDSPDSIYQSDTQWCGYASNLYEAARREPQAYAWYVICLFESGRAQARLQPPGRRPPSKSPRVFGGPTPERKDGSGGAKKMPQADYIGLAGLRNHFKIAAASVAEKIPLLNLIKDIHGSGGGELCNALKKLGCEHAHDQSTVFTARDLGYLNAASGHFDHGRIVILLIDGSMLDPPGPTGAGGATRSRWPHR